MVQLTDEQLMKAVAAGELDALATLYDRFAPRLFGLVVTIVHDRRESEDILQEVFLKAWRDREKFDPALGKPSVWLLLIVRSRALDYLRRRRRPQLAPDEILRSIPDEHDADRDQEQKESTQFARHAIAALPAEQREAILLAFYRGLTHLEIAAHQEVPLGTVKTRIRLGMARLRDLLADRFPSTAPTS